MSAVLIILLVTTSREPVDDRLDEGVVRPTIEALGGNARVVRRAFATVPDDAEVVALGAEVHADVIAEVSWSVPDRLLASIRLERAAGAPWVERQMAFRAIDDAGERSRTVALTIVSMLSPDSGAPAPADAVTKRSATLPPTGPPSTRPQAERSPSNSPNEATRDNWISAAAVAALGLTDDAGGLGGAFDYRRRAGGVWFLRLTAGARAGQAPAAQALTRFFYGGVGVAWHAFTSRDAKGALGLRMDALAVRVQLGHLSADDPVTDYQSKWLPGGDLVAEGSYFLAPGAAFFVGAGGEAVLGKTDIFVRGQRVATILPVHPVLELGLRTAF